MKIVAVSGSPRKDGNTVRALSLLLEKAAEGGGIETELISLAGRNVRGCTACGRCRVEKDGRCHGVKDDLNPIAETCQTADALILGTPVYFGSATPEIKCLMDRLGYPVRSMDKSPLERKLGGAVVVGRRAGQNFTLAQLGFYFNIMGMLQVGSSYWNILIGRDKGEIEADAEGVRTLNKYAENVRWLLDRLA